METYLYGVNQSIISRISSEVIMLHVSDNAVWYENTYPFPNFNGFTVEVWEWISIFISHYVMDVITYPCCDESQSMLTKGALGYNVPSWAIWWRQSLSQKRWRWSLIWRRSRLVRVGRTKTRRWFGRWWRQKLHPERWPSRNNQNGYVMIWKHWNGKVVKLTAPVVTGDVKACLQRVQWQPGQSPFPV